MSRKYKVSSISQADNAINDLNDDINRALDNVNQRLNNIRVEANRTAQIRARQEAERAKYEMQKRLNCAISGVNARIDRVDAEQRQRLNKVAGEIYDSIILVNDNLHDAINQTRIGLERNISALERRTNKNMRALEERTNNRINQINSYLRQLETNVAKRFEEQQSQIDSHSIQIGNLNSKVDAILAQMADERQRRIEAVSIAQGIRKATYDRVDIERFAPAQSQEIERRMTLLREPYDEGTVAAAKDLILRIQMAEEEALRNKIIYDTIHAEAISMLEKTLEEVNKNREISISHPDSPEDTAIIETDFWNHGEYGKLLAELENLKNELRHQPTVDRMREILERTAKCEVRLSGMIVTATERAILSENRVVITEDIISALTAQGWNIEKMADGNDAVGYLGGEEQDNDWREGVFAVLQSMNGERISIVVRPNDKEVDNDIIFHRNDINDVSEKEYMLSLERIKRQIAKSGYVLGPTEVPADGGNTEIPEMTDAAKLGRCGAAKIINQRTVRR